MYRTALRKAKPRRGPVRHSALPPRYATARRACAARNRDFERGIVYSADERRQLVDMYRSGAVEALAGEASAESLSAKKRNMSDDNESLQPTYPPVHKRVVGTLMLRILKVGADHDAGSTFRRSTAYPRILDLEPEH